MDGIRAQTGPGQVARWHIAEEEDDVQSFMRAALSGKNIRLGGDVVKIYVLELTSKVKNVVRAQCLGLQIRRALRNGSDIVHLDPEAAGFDEDAVDFIRTTA